MATDSYSISIVGDLNNSDLVLGSTSGYITETKSADLTNLESRTTALETRTSTLDTANLKGIFAFDSEFTQYSADYVLQLKFDIIDLPLNGVKGNIKLLPGTIGPTNDYFEYITYLTSSGNLETGGGKEINLPTINLPLYQVTPEISAQLNGKTLDHFTDNGVLGQWMEANGYSITLTSEQSYKLQYDFTNMPLWNAQDSFGNLQFNNTSLSTYLSPKMTLDRTKVVMLLDISKNDIILYSGFFQRHTDFSGTPNANGSAQNYWEPHNTWVFYRRIIKNKDYSSLFNSISQVRDTTENLETSVNTLETISNILSPFSTHGNDKYSNVQAFSMPAYGGHTINFNMELTLNKSVKTFYYSKIFEDGNEVGTNNVFTPYTDFSGSDVSFSEFLLSERDRLNNLGVSTVDGGSVETNLGIYSSSAGVTQYTSFTKTFFLFNETTLKRGLLAYFPDRDSGSRWRTLPPSPNDANELFLTFNKLYHIDDRTATLESSMNVLDNFVGDTRNVHLDKNLNGGLPMVNSILLRTDPSLTLLDLKFTEDPSNISVGGRVVSDVVNNGLNINARRQYQSKPTFNITKNGETLASSYVNKFYIGDLFTDKTFGFGDSLNKMEVAWRGGIFRNYIAKDNSDNFIFIIGGGGVASMGNGWLDSSYVYAYDRYFLDSSSLIFNELPASQYTTLTPFVDPSKNIYNLNDGQELLINYSRNFYIDVNENMNLFEPNSTLLKGSNYPIYGSMDFDVSVNKNVVINDVSGFAFALNNLQLFDSMGNLQAHSDVSFNDDLNVMCFGSSLIGSDFNFTGSVYVVGYVNDLSSTPHKFNFAALGAINGNFDFANQELSGKQNLYLNIMAHESSKTSFFNNRTVLVSWDTTKPNVPKYVSLLPELVGNKISVYNKEIVMQI